MRSIIIGIHFISSTEMYRSLLYTSMKYYNDTPNCIIKEKFIFSNPHNRHGIIVSNRPIKILKCNGRCKTLMKYHKILLHYNRKIYFE